MKEELINRAFELGFKGGNILELFDSEKPNDYYLWMCLLQKWLREEHNIHLEVIPNEEQWHTVMYPLVCIDDAGHYGDHKTYELALERGLIEALKLIKN